MAKPCQDLHNIFWNEVVANIEVTNPKHGGKAIPNMTNIVFVWNGHDPWTALASKMRP